MEKEISDHGSDGANAPAKAAGAFPKWEDGFASMTREQAQYVVDLRMKQECSWRSVAGRCNNAWNGDWDTNQIAGMDILERAEEVLGMEKGSTN